MNQVYLFERITVPKSKPQGQPRGHVNKSILPPHSSLYDSKTRGWKRPTLSTPQYSHNLPLETSTLTILETTARFDDYHFRVLPSHWPSPGVLLQVGSVVGRIAPSHPHPPVQPHACPHPLGAEVREQLVRMLVRMVVRISVGVAGS